MLSVPGAHDQESLLTNESRCAGAAFGLKLPPCFAACLQLPYRTAMQRRSRNLKGQPGPPGPITPPQARAPPCAFIMSMKYFTMCGVYGDSCHTASFVFLTKALCVVSSFVHSRLLNVRLGTERSNTQGTSQVRAYAGAPKFLNAQDNRG